MAAPASPVRPVLPAPRGGTVAGVAPPEFVMTWQLGLSRFIHGYALPGDPAALSPLQLLERQAGASTVCHVFALIWPQACIDCQAEEQGFVVAVGQGHLCHVVHVPWALVEFDRGLMLVRAVYRAGLPDALACAAVGLSLSL
jgi:hypothetical protein